MEDKYILAFDKMPSCTYREHDEVITQFAFPNSLVPNSTLLKKGEQILINNINYIIEDRIDLMGYTILKCKED